MEESGPKWGLRCHAHLIRIFRGTVSGLWRSQRKGKFSGSQVAIDSVNPYLCQQMRAFIGPPHLSLLGHAKADYFVHRRLGNSTADRQSLVVPASVVHQIPVVRSELPPGATQIPVQRGILRVVHIIDSVMNTLEPGHCLRSLAVPDQPFARSDFVT